MIDLGTLNTGVVYLVVFGLVFAESGLLFGFFLPGDTVLFAAGLIAADPARGVSLGWLIAGIVAARAGSSTRPTCRERNASTRGTGCSR